MPIITATKSQLKAVTAELLAQSSSGNGLLTQQDVLNAYAISVTIYACVNLRADNVALPPMRVVDENDKPISDHPLNAVFAQTSNYQEVMGYTEMFLSLVGHSVIIPNPNVLGFFPPTGENLLYLNPRMYTVDADNYRGFKGIRVTSGRKDLSLEPFYEPEEIIYLHTRSAINDFDGVAPTEAAGGAAGAQIEMFTTWLNYFANKMIDTVFIQPAVEQTEAVKREGGVGKAAAQAVLSMINRLGLGARNAGRSMVVPERWETLEITGDFEKLAMGELTRTTREAVCEAFGIPVELITFQASNYAQSKEAVSFWREHWLKPRVEWYGQQFSNFFTQWYGKPVFIKPDFSELLSDDKDKLIERAERKYKAGFISLYQAALESGVKEPSKFLMNLYHVDGMGAVPVQEVPNIWRYKQLIAPSVYNSEVLTGEPLPQPVDPNQVVPTDAGGEAVADPTTQLQAEIADTDKAVEGDGRKGLWVGLSLANHPDLIDLQDAVRKLVIDPAVEWTAPEDYHVTVLSAPMVDEAIAREFAEALQELDVPDLSLKVGSLGAFDAMGRHSLHLRIGRNAALLEYQAQLFDLAQEHGIQCGGFSNPAKYQPHITVAYIPEHMKQVTYKGKVTVEPLGVRCDYGDVTLWKSEDDTKETNEPIRVSKAVFSELEVAVRKAFKAQAFTPSLITSHTVDYIKHLHEVGIDRDTTLIAAKAHYTGIAAAKALSDVRAQFDTALVSLFKRAQSEKISKNVFIERMRILLTRYAQQAITAGVQDGGIEDFDLFDSEDENAVEALAWVQDYTSDGGEQAGYIRGVADVLYSDEQLTDNELEGKPALWFSKSVMPAYLHGLGIASKNGLFEWVLGKAEHCKSCLALSGQKRTWKFWNARILPRDSRLACGGYNCACNLKPATGKKNRGDLPAWKSLEDGMHQHSMV